MNSKKKSRKGIKLNLTKAQLHERARKAAETRRENRAREEGIRGESRKIIFYLDEFLLDHFDKSRKVAHDLTLTAGIRRAMQDYIDKHPS